MKKIITLVLAFAMILSLSSVIFASDNISFGVSDAGILIDDNSVQTLISASSGNTNFGESVYYRFFTVEGAAESDVTASDTAKEFKVSAKWELGADYIEDVKIVPKNVYPMGSSSGAKNVIYLIEVSTKDSFEETEAKDVIGTITLKSNKYDFDGKKEKTLNAAFTLSNKPGDIRYTTDENMVYSFAEGSDDQEIELFGEMGRFCVDTRGQGDIVLRTDVNYNEGIENVYSDTAYVYFNSNNATFNKIGTLYLNAEQGSCLYRVNSDGTLKMSSAPYDEDEGAFKIKTRVLGSYVIAEGKLDTEVVNAAVEKKEEPAKKQERKPEKIQEYIPVNPRTGI